jgi:polysaccharide biosynthesis protein PelA
LILWVGPLPLYDPTSPQEKPLIDLLARNFGFSLGSATKQNSRGVQILSKSSLYDYEVPLNHLTLGDFHELKILEGKFEALLHLKTPAQVESKPVFLAPWGLYAQGDKILFTGPRHRKWLINPFQLLSRVFTARFPIPDTTTLQGKRIFYSHVDGDGAFSKTEVRRHLICAEMAKFLLTDYRYPIGISFITHELSSRFEGAKRLQKAARELFALDHVEPASHTHSHPYSWKMALSAYPAQPGEDTSVEWGEASAFAKKDGSLDLSLEVDHSLRLISALTPQNKEVKTLYYSGDCSPTLTHLQYLKSKSVLAFNGGDSFFDDQHPSLTYVHPLTRFVDGLRQVYSSNSNENLYTHLWTRQFWGFRRVIETFERTGSPIRIKPINLYYHFYALEKRSSYNALKTIYDYIGKKAPSLRFISPSNYIQLVKNFFEIEIQQLGKQRFRIRQARFLKDFRWPGKVQAQGENLASIHYDPKQNLSYIHLGPQETATLSLVSEGP